MGKSNVNKMQTAAAKSTQSHLASTQAAALAATNAPTSRPPLPLAPFDLDVPAYHTPDVDDRPVNWPVYPQRDTVHATALNLDTKSRRERFATPQGTFMFRKTRGERCPMPIISMSTYVCSCFAVVVNGTTSAGFTPVGYIFEDLGDTTLRSWLASGAAGAKDAGLQLVCVVRDVLRGLRAVHESGFVYGDSLKSSKIMITHSGAAKLLQPSSGISSAAVPVHDDMRALGRLLLQWVGVVPNAADSLGPLIRALTGDGEPPSAADALKLVPADDVAAFSRQAGALLARSTTCLDEFDHVKVATADNADVQLSLTCIGLATAMSRLMSAQRARSLACARELADLVTRFHSHDTRLPVKESVLYKLYLAAVDVLLDLNTTADNASASVLLASTPCEDVMGGAIPKEAFVARTARVQRQQGRVAEARTLLETHLTADGTQEYKSSAGYALLINEQLKLLTLYGTSSEVETAVTSIDVSGIHIYCFPAVTCTLARARLRLGRFLDGLIAARLFNDVQLHLAQHVGMVHPWYAINSVDQAEAFRLQGGEVPRRAQEGLKQALLFLNGKLDSDHPAIRHALRSSLDTALGGDLTAPATRKAVLQCAEALLAAQRTALGKQHPQYFAAMKTKAEALLAFTTPQTSDVNGVVKLCDQILEGLESAGGVETRAIASAKCLKAQALLLRKSSENAQQCLDLYDEVLQMTFHTPRSPYVDAYCGKAVVKQTIGNPSDCIEALAYLDAAEELLLKADSPNEVAKILWQKEPLLKALGRNHALLELYDRIFALEASTAPANDPDLTLKRLLTLKGNQANVLQEVGGPENLLKADELYTQIYEEKCMLLGPEHESTISTLANRASARQRLDDEKQVQKAVDDYDIVIKAHSKVLGPTHSRVLTTMCNKAIALTRLTDADSLTSSIDLFEKVLAERTRTLKRSHPLVLSTLVNFTIALRKAGNERCLLRADTLYDIMLSRQDLEDAERISTMRYQALGLVALGHRGELPKAIRLCDAALAKVAPNHPVAVELQQAKAAAKAILAAREGAA